MADGVKDGEGAALLAATTSLDAAGAKWAVKQHEAGEASHGVPKITALQMSVSFSHVPHLGKRRATSWWVRSGSPATPGSCSGARPSQTGWPRWPANLSGGTRSPKHSARRLARMRLRQPQLPDARGRAGPPAGVQTSSRACQRWRCCMSRSMQPSFGQPRLPSHRHTAPGDSATLPFASPDASCVGLGCAPRSPSC